MNITGKFQDQLSWKLITIGTLSNMTRLRGGVDQSTEIQPASIPFEWKFSCWPLRLHDRLFLLKVPKNNKRNCSRKVLQSLWPWWETQPLLALKEALLLDILTRNISSNLFPWVLVNMWEQFLKENCMLPTFQKWTFCGGLYGENDGPSIWGKRHEKHMVKL